MEDLALDVVGRTVARVSAEEHMANYQAANEWVAVQDVESAVTACTHLAALWERKG